ncbi:MAG: hypothetical protein AB7K71_24190 [Polyangiaceae bacterium]
MDLDCYLEALPYGIDSFESAQVKASMLRTALGVHAPDPAPLPPRLAALVRDPPPPNTWVTEVEYQCVLLATGDELGYSDSAYADHTYRVAKALYASPMYASLMRVAGPALILKGASLRWSNFRRGTKLDARTTKASSSVRMTFPHGLFLTRNLLGFTGVFRATLEGAGVRAEVELVREEPGVAIYEANW